MFSYLNEFWRKLSTIGLSENSEHPEQRLIIITNQFMAVLIAVFSGYFFLYLALDIKLAAAYMALFILVYLICYYISYRKYYLTSRVLGVSLQILFIFLSAITAGINTRVIDFLIIAALVPAILFDIRHLKFIILFVTQCFVFYMIYSFYYYSFPSPILSDQQQQILYYVAIPMKFVCMFIITLVIMKSNRDQAIKYQEQNSILEGQKNYYHSLLDKLPIDVVMHDKNLRYAFINKNAVKDEQLRKWLIGKDNLQYVKHRNLNVKVAEDRNRTLKKAILTKEIQIFEETMIDRYGKLVSSVKGTIPIFNEISGEVTSLISYSVNITERKLAEEKLKETVLALERKNTELKHFAFGVSHDLKTPLRNISTYLQLLQRKNNLDADSNEMIASAVKSVKHLHQLINDIFLYTSSDSNNVNAEKVNVKTLVAEICTNMKSFIEEHNAEIKLSNSLPEIFINSTHATHLFSNLIVNAIKYNKSLTPLIEINYGYEGNKVLFYVKDNGIGIAPAYLQQIFEIFKRLHTQEEYEGTGIGLSLCKKIVEIYGGKIEVSSVEGKGTSFCFSLPGVSTT